MPRYFVTIAEVWERSVELEAESEEEALTRVKEGNYTKAEEQEFSYQYALEGAFTVEEVTE